eukprot:gene13528-biopygen15414
MRCSRSRFAHYCCQAHQKAAWRAYYRQECEALVACAPRIPPASVRLAARVLWRRASEFPHQQPDGQQQQRKAAGGTFTDVKQLLNHWEQLDGKRKIQYAQMAVLTRQYMLHSTNEIDCQQAANAVPGTQQTTQPEQPDWPGSVKEIAQLLACFACNNHTVCDEELRPIGVGLYPRGALINHSCSPNCVQSFAGSRIVFRSLCQIPSGVQLTISYVELAATRQERRRQLLQQYFFDIDTPQQQQQQLQAPGAACTIKQLRCLPGSSAQEAVHQLHPCSDGSLSTHDSSSVELLAYGNTSGSTPPWPTDPADRHLCRMGLLLQGSAAQAGQCLPYTLALQSSNGSSCGGCGSSSSSSSNAGSSRSQHCLGQLQPLPGGMCLLPVDVALQQSAAQCQVKCNDFNPDAPQSADNCGKSVSNDTLQAVSGLFADLQGLELTADLSNIDSHDSHTDDSTYTAQHISAGMPGELRCGPGVATTNQGQQQQQQQYWQAVQWGDWSSAVASVQEDAATARSGCVSTALEALVNTAASVLMHIQQLHQKAEQLSRQGQAAAAVVILEQALQCADGLAALPRSKRLCSAAAVAAAGSEPQNGNVSNCEAAVFDAERALAGPNGGDGGDDGKNSRDACRPTLGSRHILRLRLAAGLLKSLVDQGADWKAAYAVANALTPLYELVYPKVWPNLGLHYAMVAKLAMLLQHPGAALAAAEAAGNILHITHGSSSCVLQEVMRLRWEAQQELEAFRQRH